MVLTIFTSVGLAIDLTAFLLSFFSISCLFSFSIVFLFLLPFTPEYIDLLPTFVISFHQLAPFLSTEANILIFVTLQTNPPSYNILLHTYTQTHACTVDWGCRIHWLHLCRRIRPPNECPVYDTKQSDDEVPVMLELWGMRSTPPLPLFPGPLWPGVAAPDRALSMG